MMMVLADDRIGEAQIVTGSRFDEDGQHFEWVTKVKGSNTLDGTVRYPTREDALIGHQAIVARVANERQT